MRYFEIHDPYYALVKAENKEKAREEYVLNVADDDGTLLDKMEEVSRDYALIKLAQSKDEEGKLLTPFDVIEQFNDDGVSVLLIDGCLI